MQAEFGIIDRVKIAVLACALAFSLGGCAPGLGTTFPLRTIATVPVDDSTQHGVQGVRVRWGDFSDERSSPVIADINGRELEAEQEPARAARRIVEAQFREAGIRPGLFEGVEVQAQLQEWKVLITPGFPSTKIEARAGIRLAIVGPSKSAQGQPPPAARYAARYRGVVAEEHPIGSNERIERVLAQALAEAAAEALRDPQFVAELKG